MAGGAAWRERSERSRVGSGNGFARNGRGIGGAGARCRERRSAGLRRGRKSRNTGSVVLEAFERRSHVTVLWSNPEFLRNARAQLRPGKVAATACVCAALSVVIGYAVSHPNGRQLAAGPARWGVQVLATAFWLQPL